MTINNPTVDDMRIIASNIKADGQTSRAEFLYTLSNDVEALQARITELETFVREVVNDDLDRVSGGIKNKAAALLKSA
jgi:hypothetical protein